MILVCDLTRPITLERIDRFLNMAKESNIEADSIILAGSKTDLYFDRCVSPEYLESFLQEYDNISENGKNLAGLIETSARTNHNIDVLFELAIGLAMNKKGLISDSTFDLFKLDLEHRIEEPIYEPQDRIVKKCWKCKRALLYYEFASANSTIDEDTLVDLWQSPYIELYCCNCYKQEVNKKYIRNNTIF